MIKVLRNTNRAALATISTAVLFFSGPALAIDLAIKNASVLKAPFETAQENQTLLIDDGVIIEINSADSIAIPDDAEVIDANGLFVLPGFWNAHVHFAERKWAGAAEAPDDTLQGVVEASPKSGFLTPSVGRTHAT